MKKTFIIHPGLIGSELGYDYLSPNDRTILQMAHSTILNTVARAIKPISIHPNSIPPADCDVYVLPGGNPLLIKGCILPGDEVELMGTSRETCLPRAASAAKEAGATRITLSSIATVSCVRNT